MNERIKQLAEQAVRYALDKANEGEDEDYEYSFDDDFQEKFAQLIVRECASICDKLEDEGVYHGVGEEHGTASIASAADCSFYIKEHFGVEE
jgi:hypothetical protein